MLSVFGYCNLSDISSALVRAQGSDIGREGGQYLYCNTVLSHEGANTETSSCQPNLSFS